MRPLYRILWIGISNCLIFSAYADEYKIYDRDPYTGLRYPFPSKSIEVKKDRIKQYDYNSYGLKSMFPEREVEIKRQPTLPRTKINPDLLPQGSVILEYPGTAEPYRLP